LAPRRTFLIFDFSFKDELGDESRIFENITRHQRIQTTCTSWYQWQTGLEAL
jgi:hypothetical protein